MRVLRDPDIDLDGLWPGFEAVAEDLGLELGEGPLDVRVLRMPVGDDSRDRLRVVRAGDRAEVHYSSKSLFFRGIGLLAEALRHNADCDISESARFGTIGPMIDVSRGNSVPKVPVVMALIRRLALMGMNLLQLYAEDSYVVPGEPWFGYMRGKYTADDMRAIDDYADLFGIELVPCIQTFGRLHEVLDWPGHVEIRDDESTLAGHSRTTELVERMVAAASFPVRSKRIHIGIPGGSLAHNDSRPSFEIVRQHVALVAAIAKEHDLHPMMWSDVFSRALSNDPTSHDESGVPAADILRALPDGVQLVYRNYDQTDVDFHKHRIREHKEFGHPPVFAGGIQGWRSFGINYGLTFATTNAALAACKAEGVTEVLATLWGDDGTECDFHAGLLGLQLFAEHCFTGEPEVDQEKLARRFEICCSGVMNDFMALRNLDETPGVPETNPECVNPSRFILWQQVSMGLFDANVDGLPLAEHYDALAQTMRLAAHRNPAHKDVFEFYALLCDALSAKVTVGLRLAAAYRDDDSDVLRKFAEVELPDLFVRIKQLREAHRARWHDMYLPFGWEVIDGRYGHVLQGVDTAIWRLSGYLDGESDRIEELEEQRLPYRSVRGLVSGAHADRMQSGSRVAWHED